MKSDPLIDLIVRSKLLCMNVYRKLICRNNRLTSNYFFISLFLNTEITKENFPEDIDTSFRLGNLTRRTILKGIDYMAKS